VHPFHLHALYSIFFTTAAVIASIATAEELETLSNIPGGSPLTRMCQVVAASFRKRNLAVPEGSSLLYETPDKSSAIAGSRKLEHSDELRLVFPYFEFTFALFSALVTLVKNNGVCSMNNNKLFLIFLLKWNAPSLQIQSSLIKGNVISNMSPTIML
jgi:hypothetical protein